MRVGVDARHLAGARGVAHYTAGLLEALAKLAPQDEWLLFAPGTSELALPPPGARLVRHRLPSRALFGSAALVGRPRLDRLLGGALDVVLVPAPAPLALSPGVPLVLTVHDLSFEERPSDFTAYERLWHRLARLRRLAARASRVLVDTAVVGEEVRQRWGIDADRIVVAAPGVSAPRSLAPDEIEAVRARHGIPARYLLFVGALEPRKAPEVLVRAFERARREGLDSGLVLAGSGRLAPQLNADGVVLAGGLGRAELEALYAGATALVMPSWLEGFGLPPLEALAYGTPPLVSDLPVFAETLGEAALRFPVGDERALAAALLQIDSDVELRARLVAAGAERLAHFSWENSVHAAYGALVEAAAE